MVKPNVSWYVKEEDDVFVAHTNYHAGTCIPDSDFIIDIQLWNNRWNNSEDAKDMTNAKLILSFAYAEDSILLSLCKVKIGNGPYSEFDLSEFNRGIVELGDISGEKNDGSADCTNNYRDISLKFSGIPANLKNSLKSMYFDVQFDDYNE